MENTAGKWRRSGTLTARTASMRVCVHVRAWAWVWVCTCVQAGHCAVIIITAIVQHSGICKNIPKYPVQTTQPPEIHRSVFLVYSQLCTHPSGS